MGLSTPPPPATEGATGSASAVQLGDTRHESPQVMTSVGNGAFEGGDWRKYAAIKVSTEYDSEGNVFLNKISARLLEGLGKIKASFQRDQSGEFRFPMLGFSSKYLSILYNHEERDSRVTASGFLGPRVQMKYMRDVRAQEGEVKLIAQTADANYQAEIAYDVPPSGLPRVSLIFPFGQLRAEEEQREEDRVLSISGFVAGKILKGIAMADYRDEVVGLKYKYKDYEMTIAPSISLPSQEVMLFFKRQFNSANKLSYMYNFDSTAWSAIYKNKTNENFKFKAGYDSAVRLGWLSAWVGKEEAGVKHAPRKCKFQIMLQVPQDDPRSPTILFNVKKRWDL